VQINRRLRFLLTIGFALVMSSRLTAVGATASCDGISIDGKAMSAQVANLTDAATLPKLRQDLFSAVPHDLPRADDLTSVGRQLAWSAAHSGITDQTTLADTLTQAMKRACQKLSSSASTTVADAVAAALNTVVLPTPGSSQYLFFLGSVNSLQAQGGFTSNLAASLLSRTPFAGAHQPKESDSTERTTDGVVELTYAKIGAVATATPAASGTPPATPAQNAAANPFTSASGILRGNASLEQTVYKQFVGATAGFGFTSRTNSTTDTTARVSPRFFVGALVLADYGAADGQDHTTGRVVLAYARDKFWQPEGSTDTSSPNQPNRIVLDARIDSPGVFKSKSVKFSFQIFADAPMASHGPADVRFSLLISTDIQALLGIT
jgi:hypothetical protein